MSIGEIIDAQSEIISIQAKTISELYGLLGQYLAVEELDEIPSVMALNEIVGNGNEIGGVDYDNN